MLLPIFGEAIIGQENATLEIVNIIFVKVYAILLVKFDVSKVISYLFLDIVFMELFWLFSFSKL